MSAGDTDPQTKIGELSSGELGTGELGTSGVGPGEPNPGEPNPGEPNPGEPNAGQPNQVPPQPGDVDSGQVSDSESSNAIAPDPALMNPDTTPAMPERDLTVASPALSQSDSQAASDSSSAAPIAEPNPDRAKRSSRALSVFNARGFRGKMVRWRRQLSQIKRS